MNQYSSQPYFITIEASPLPGNPQGKTLKKAIALIWVFETSPDPALEKAIRYVTEYGWTSKKVIDVLQPQPELLAQLDTQKAMVLRHAELYGVSGEFHAFPETDQPGVYYFESLKKPPKK